MICPSQFNYGRFFALGSSLAEETDRISQRRPEKGRFAALGDSAHFYRADCTRPIDGQRRAVPPTTINSDSSRSVPDTA
jgi:hypothetical protein